MAGQGGNDFFLNFGSNAKPFADDLVAGLDPGVKKINALRKALADYEAQAAQSKKGSSPLGLTFEGLDAAAERIEKATENFSRNFAGQLTALTTRVNGLQDILTQAARRLQSPGVQPTPGRGNPSLPPPAPGRRGDSEDYLRRLAVLQAQDREKAGGGKRAREAADAQDKLATANQMSTKDIKATTTALRSLNQQLQAIITNAEKFKSGSGGGTVPENALAAVQIGNTPANPIPVVVVGGEAHAAGGHPAAHHGPTPTATTATSDAKARAEVEAAAEVVNLPNSRKNPTRVSPGDVVAPGQYFLLPGDDAKQPRRAYGIRPGETVGTYVHRVEGVQGRVAQALGKVPGLSTEERAALDAFRQSGGKIPEPKVVSTPLERVRTMSAEQQAHIDSISAKVKDFTAQINSLDGEINRQYELLTQARARKKASRPYLNEYNGLVEQREGLRAQREEARESLRQARGADLPGEMRGIRTGAYVATPEKARVTESLPMDIPQDVRGIIEKRNAAYQAELEAAHQAMLQELLRDPRMTQDALPPSVKTALRGIDEIMLNPEQEFGRGNPEQDQRVLRSLFGDRHNFTQEDVGYFLEGATRRRYLADSGADRAEALKARRSVWKQQRKLDARAEEQAKSDAWIDNLHQAAQDAAPEHMAGHVKNTGVLYRNATSLIDRISGTSPEEFSHLGTRQELERLLASETATERSEINEKLRRAKAAVRRNQQRGRGDLAAKHLEAQQGLEAQLAAITPRVPTQPELLRAAREYEALLGSRLADRVTARPGPEPEAVEPVKPVIPTSPRTGRPLDAETVDALNAGSNEETLRKLRKPKLQGLLAATQFAGYGAGVGEKASKDQLVQALLQAHQEFAAESTTVSGAVEETSKRSRRRGRPKEGESQAVSAVSEATGEVEKVKAEIHDLNAKLSAAKTRLERTHPGSQRNQQLTNAVAKLEQQKAGLVEERKRLNRATARRAGRSKSEQAAASTPEGLLAAGLITPGELELVREYQQSQQRRSAGGGGGNKPPVPPVAPPAAPEPEPEPKPQRPRKVRAGDTVGAHEHQFAALQEETQRTILEQRAAIASATSPEERLAAVRKAADALVADPAYKKRALWGTDALRANTGRTRALAGLLGLDEEHTPTRGAVRGARIDAQNAQELAATRSAAAGLSEATDRDTGATERLARMEQELTGASGRLLETRLALIRAENDLAQARARVAATPDMTDAQKISTIAPYEQRYAAAARANQAEEQRAAAQANRSMYSRITGRPNSGTLGQDLLRHGSLALTNTIGYSLVFSGFEKLREVMQTGIEVQAIFVRLQASLDANGIAAGNLQTKLGAISANTATPLEQVTEAAAELAGSFNTIGNRADRLANIEFATNIASQLANISQGALTAQQAAEGLRDVIYAYGDAWAKSGMSVQQGLQQSGDQIAHLSQLTGVSVKDITEGTTQIAMEANEFGLSQRQASTLAAYITAGTGESGEASAAQASRMLATLYNGKTQNILERTYLYGKDGQLERDKNGNPVTLATPQQFEQGKIGDVLTNIAANWSKLNPRQKQAISAMMGTGIQARAFAAYVGGGTMAAAEMNGTANDKGSLSKQNQSYLDTVAGMIKQLDEDFQNLGSTLQRLGAFDAIGLLAKSLDELLKTINKYVGDFASLMNSNPLTSGLMKWSVLLLEAAAAWKVFGGAVTRAMVGMKLMNITPTNQAAIDEARMTPGAAVPAPIYGRAPFRNVIGTVGGRAAGGIAGRARRAGSYVRDVAVDHQWVDLTPAGMHARAAVTASQATLATAVEAESKAEAEVTAALEKRVAAEAAVQEASERLAAAEQSGSASETELNALIVARGKVNRELLAAEQALARAQAGLSEATAAQQAASEEAAAATQRQAEVRNAGMRSGFGGMPIRGGASIAAMMLAGPLGDLISGGQARGSGLRGMAGATASDLTMGAGIGGMIGGPVGAALGAVAGTAWGAFGAVGDAKKKMDALPSGYSDQLYTDLSTLVYNIPGSGRAIQNAQGQLGFKNASYVGVAQLGKLSTTDAVKKWQDAEIKMIDKHAKEIEKAGFNNPTAQKAIAAQIDTLKSNIEKSGTRRIGELQGLAQIDQLTANQVQSLGQVLGQIGSLSPSTLSSQSAAITTLLQNSGLPTGSVEYQDLLRATAVGPINTIGINNKGQIGSYSADGNWHAASRQELAGIGPTEATHLTQLGGGPNATGGDIARLEALREGYKKVIDNATVKLSNPADTNPQDLQTWQANLNTGLTGYDQTTKAIFQAPITQAQGNAGMLAALGGTPTIAASLGLGGGGDQAAISQLQKANEAIQNYNSTLTETDPQYWQNLQQIQQNKAQIADLQATPEINRLELAAAQATDATAQANIKYQQMVEQLQLDQKKGATSKTIGTDRANIAAAGIGQRQVAEQIAQAQAALNVAGVRNSATKARMNLGEAQRLMGVYGPGGALANQADYINAQTSAEQDRLALSDALEAQKQSTYDAAAALQTFHGDALGAARTELKKAQDGYVYAVQQYGKNSQEAHTALQNLYQAEQSEVTAALTEQNANLQLEESLLTARGQAGDLAKAAQDKVKEVQNTLRSYLAKGGKAGTSEYKQLLGQLASAQRAAFDQQLQDQLDTLDFQQQTYKITSAQEVASLQQILKNKQLTLKEQRDITLKIKNLQESIRQQLTQGGLNIPSDIKLPTAYEVRRSLGAGFAGSGAQVNTVNNNQQVQINNNVPSAAVANAIVNQVVKVLNQQFAAQSRATTSTPRVVPTR